MKLAKIVIAATAACLAPQMASAVVYNVVTDFDTSASGNSASGRFRYAYFDNAADTSLTDLSVGGCSGGFACVRAPGVDSLGVTEFLAGGDTATGTAFFRSGYLNMHSGPNGQQAAIAFVADAAGTYSFDGRFQFHDISPSGVTTAAYSGGKTTAYLPLIALTALGRDFTFSQTLAAGESVIFVIDPAGTYSNDSTGFRLSVNDGSAVPEPATWAMLLLGFGIVGVAARRRTIRPVIA